MDFWERLDWLIKERGTSRKELATRLGLALSAVSVWKSRRAYPDADVALALARALGVTVEYLIEGPMSEEPVMPPDEAEPLFLNFRISNENELLQSVVARLLSCDQVQLAKIKEMMGILLE